MPDTLHVSRRVDGGLVAVGLPSDAGVFVQEYWTDDTVHYAVANVSATAVTLAFSEWHGQVGRQMLGPWHIAPKTVGVYDANALVGSAASPLLAVSLDDQPVYGLLRAPALPGTAPIREPRAIVTIEGLNGIGERGAGLWFVQEKLIFDAGEVATVRLYAPGGTKRMFVGQPEPPRGLPAVSIVSVESTTFSVEREQGRVVLESPAGTEPSFHEVSLAVRMPDVRTPMTALIGRIATPGGGGFSFGRGLVTSRPA